MNDNEIIKALECCSKGGDIACRACPRFANGTSPMKCAERVMADTLDLINRLQAENERLQKQWEGMPKTLASIKKIYVTAKSAARKEFAERVLEASAYCDADTDEIIIFKSEFDSILKELDGKENETP